MLSNETKQNRYLSFVFKSVPHYTDAVSLPDVFWGEEDVGTSGYNLHLQVLRILSLCHRRNLFIVSREIKIQWCRDGNENVQKTIGLI